MATPKEKENGGVLLAKGGRLGKGAGSEKKKDFLPAPEGKKTSEKGKKGKGESSGKIRPM